VTEQAGSSPSRAATEREAGISKLQFWVLSARIHDFM